MQSEAKNVRDGPPYETGQRNHVFRPGFVAAAGGPLTSIRRFREVLETRGGYSIVKEGGQVWLENSSGVKVSGPVAATGAFIMYGKLKDLTGVGGSTANPLVKSSAEKNEFDKEEEAEDSLDAKASGRSK